MKINSFFLLVSLLLTAIFAYACNVYCQNNFKTLFIVASSLGTLLYFIFLLAINYNNSRTSINIKTLSSLFLLINISLLFYFSAENSDVSAFVILYSIILLLYASLVYAIYKIKT
jgi:hypothetical protein